MKSTFVVDHERISRTAKIGIDREEIPFNRVECAPQRDAAGG